MAVAWSENAWANRTPGGVGAGLVALATMAVAGAVALKKDPMLVALQGALSFLFLYEAMDRGLGLDVKTNLWILDGLLVAALAVTTFGLRKPGGPTWLLGAFTSFLYASLVLLLISGIVVWHMERHAVIPADIWLITVAGLSVWGLQETIPEHLRHEGYERQLAYCVFLWIPFGFFTALVAMEAGPNTAAVMVAGGGLLGLWFALPRGSRPVLVASCLTLLSAAWYYGAAKAGALGAVLALAAVAVVLLWASSRMANAHGAETAAP
jgi:hypothetical protein